MAEVTPEKLHGCAVEAEKNLEELATGLAQAGAPEAATKAVTRIADAVRDIVKSLAGAAQAAPAPEQEQPETMDTAADGMMAEANAKRAGGQ